jgi:hypothetical protein
MINYSIIADSIEFYEKEGFKRVEAPWTVTQATLDITKPVGATSFTIQEKDKSLVASGEQSFLYLYTKGFLPLGQFQTVTPCFRDDKFDALHTKYFIKNELIKTDSVTESDLYFVIDTAMEFFERWMGTGVVSELTGDYTYDILYKGIELGSYGIRKCDFLTWIYGTGVAEPRMTRTMKKYGLSLKENP